MKWAVACQRALSRQLSKRSPGDNAFLLLLPLVGFGVGLSSVGIAHIMAYIQKLFWGSGHNLLDAASATPWYFRVAILGLAGLTVGLIGWLFGVETRGAGTSGLIQALALKGGYISLRETLPRVAAGIITVAMGGSLGREGPVAQLAAPIGSRIARQFRLPSQQVRVLTCSAAAAAIAAVYNAPIGGSILALEVFIGSFALEVLGPVVVASVISTLVFRSCMGNLPRFVIPQYELISGWELIAYLLLGIAAGGVSVLFVKSLFWVEDGCKKLRAPKWALPATGMLAVGGIGCAYPQVFGNGYEVVNLALHEELPLLLLVVVPLVKLVATALTLGSGGGGGLFMPTLAMGALLGGAFGYGVHHWFPATTAEHGAYALVGMGAVLAGTTWAPIMAILMIFEQTNSYQIILPLMFVCIISTGVARLLMPLPMHLETLRRRGVALPSGPEASVMRTLRVADVMHDDVRAVNHSVPFPMVVEWFLNEPHNNLYVVDGAGRFLGAIRLHALKNMLHQADALTSVVACDLVDEGFEFVTPGQNLADVMEKFWRERAERLPVVNDPSERKLVGWLSKRDLFGVYSQEILRKRQLMGHFVVTSENEKQNRLVELPEGFELQSIELPPHLADCTLADLSPRSAFGVHVIALRRPDPMIGRDSIKLAEPHFPLNAGDRLVVIGKADSIARFTDALAFREHTHSGDQPVGATS